MTFVDICLYISYRLSGCGLSTTYYLLLTYYLLTYLITYLLTYCHICGGELGNDKVWDQCHIT